MNSFDIIIPVARKDVSFVPRVVDYVDRCITLGVEHIYILTSKKNTPKLCKRLKSYSKCVLVDEDQLIEGLSYERISSLLEEIAPVYKNKAGWYFQQFLKFAFAQSKYSTNYYLSWDADTLPLSRITFFENDHLLYNPKNENNPNYFKTINKLFGFGKQVKHSFVSESMIFSTQIVKQMLEDIQSSSIQGCDWIEKILRACDFSTNFPAFSEFETYGTYCCVKFPNLYKTRHLNTFREAGFINGRRISDKRLLSMSFDLDVASFEYGHEPLFPYNLPHIYRKMTRLLRNSPKEWVSFFSRKFGEKQEDNLEKMLFRLPPKNKTN